MNASPGLPGASRIVVIAIGNPSRGDDALGPMLVERLGPGWPAAVVTLTEFQLQIEHVLDLAEATLVLFVDAERGLAGPCRLRELRPDASPTVFSHALSPAQLLGLYASTVGCVPPPAFVLGLAAEGFDLGAPLSERAIAALEAGCRRVRTLLSQPGANEWRLLCETEEGGAQ